jgi:hypothetical protein
MKLWEIRNSGINELRVLVFKNMADLLSGVFELDGKPKHWANPPQIAASVEKRKKVQKPRADISYLMPGTLILNKKAATALKPFLLRFGELLEVDCDGEIEYLYNVTNIIACIDYEKSTKAEGGSAVIKEVFMPSAIPDTEQIFKDPYRLTMSIYVSESAKHTLEKLITDAQLTGAQFFGAGESQ